MAKRLLLLAAISMFPLFLMGDFCSDVLSVPVYFEDDERLDLKLDQAQMAKTKAAFESGNYVVMNVEAALGSDGDSEISPPVPYADADEPFTLNACDKNTPSDTTPGIGCICVKDKQWLAFAKNCLLGRASIDIAGQDKSIKSLKDVIEGIFIRKVTYSMPAKKLAMSIPSLEVKIRRLVVGEDKTLKPFGDWASLGVVEPMERGYGNSWLFDLNDAILTETDKTKKEELTAELKKIERDLISCDPNNERICSCQEFTKDCDKICSAGTRETAKFICAKEGRVRLNVADIDKISDIIKTLLFEVQVAFPEQSDIDISQILSVEPDVRAMMKLNLQLVIVVKPNL